MNVKRFLAFSFLFFVGVIFFSCAKNNDYVFCDFNILSPDSKKQYYEDTAIVFSTDLNSSDFIWTSDLDGELGRGNQIIKKLTSGKHKISLKYGGNGIEKTVEINVNQREDLTKLEMITAFSFEVPGKRNRKEIAVVSLNGTSSNVSLLEKAPVSEDLFYPVLNNALLDSPVYSKKTSNCRSAASEMENEKEFKIINTLDQSSSHTITGVKIDSPSGISVFVEKNIFQDGSYNKNIEKCVNDYVKIILPRLKGYCGSVADIDNSGSLTVVFSQTLNSEGKAVGFFYPMDFFPRNTDVTSKNYNPYSNEMDVIYVGVPVTEEQDNYSVQSITATLAHETTHAVAFSERVVFTELHGKQKLDQLELFLDEGLAHLSESLCGFGVSGGNSRFVDYYLKHSKDYSFCKNDVFGYSDSIGQRGAISLFLYWIFEKAGGRVWDNSKGEWKDTGGYSFLKRIVSSELPAWESIGESFGIPTDLLLIQFCKDLFQNKIDFTEVDPETNEMVFPVSVPEINLENTGYKIIPYSFFIIDAGNTGSFVLNGEKISGQIYVLYD